MREREREREREKQERRQTDTTLHLQAKQSLSHTLNQTIVPGEQDNLDMTYIICNTYCSAVYTFIMDLRLMAL